MAENGRFHNFVNVTTDTFGLVREIFIVTLFVLLLFWPTAFSALLTRVGISKVPTPFGDIDVKEAGNTVAALNRGLTDTVSRLQEIQATNRDPKGKQELKEVSDYLQDLQEQAQATDQSLKTNLASQQAALEKTSPQSAQLTGWLFLGRVTEDKSRWAKEGPKDVAPTLSAMFTVGQRFTVTAPAYVHDNAPAGGHFGGKLIGVISTGERVEVIAPPEYSHAIAGGFFLWLNVKRVS